MILKDRILILITIKLTFYNFLTKIFAWKTIQPLRPTTGSQSSIAKNPLSMIHSQQTSTQFMIKKIILKMLILRCTKALNGRNQVRSILRGTLFCQLRSSLKIFVRVRLVIATLSLVLLLWQTTPRGSQS